MFDSTGVDAAYSRWLEPPMRYEIDPIKIKDEGKPCESCDTHHAVCEIGEENSSGRFGNYLLYCSRCALEFFGVDFEASVFDSKE